jgi:hypothetical protein
MQRDREAFAKNVAASICDYESAPRAFKTAREESRVQIAKNVELLWSEFERIERQKTGETINGATTKTEWAICGLGRGRRETRTDQEIPVDQVEEVAVGAQWYQAQGR